MTRSISQLEALLLDLPHISDEVKEGIRQLANDAKRFEWLIEMIDWLPPGWNGLKEGRFDCYLKSNEERDLRKYIDAAIGGNAE